MAEQVIVVGAGIFGTCGALELKRRGHQVLLIDPGPLPQPEASSTDISKVIRMDYGSDEFTMALMERALQGWRRWNEAWDEPLFHEVGFLLLSSQPLQPGSYEGDSYQLLLARGHQPERLNAANIAQRFPKWADGQYVDGYFNPEAGWAQSGAVVSKLLEEAQRSGVDIQVGQGMEHLVEVDGRVVGVRTADEVLEADWVVLAAGAWSTALLPALGDKLWPVGQPVIHFQAPSVEAYQPPSFVPWAADIAETGWYGFPALADGTLKIANHGPGRRLPPGQGAQVRPEDEQRFRAFLSSSLPELVEASRIDSRVCFYSDSWDGDFYIDRVPGKKGLVVASGGSGHGFKFAPILGELIADALEGVANPSLRRYRWRSAGERRTEEARHN